MNNPFQRYAHSVVLIAWNASPLPLEAPKALCHTLKAKLELELDGYFVYHVDVDMIDDYPDFITCGFNFDYIEDKKDGNN